MLQRWMITLMVSAVSCVMFSACKQKTFSPDEPLAPQYSPSVFVTSQNRYLYAVDPVTGQQKWEFNLHGPANIATPVVVGKNLYVSASDAAGTDDTLFKIDVNSGKLIRAFTDSPYFRIEGTPVTDGKFLYIAANRYPSNEAHVFAVNTENDSKVWETVLSGGANKYVAASLALYQDRLIVASVDGTISCLSKNNGTPLWPTAASIPIVGTLPILSSPAVSYPYILIGSPNGKMYALDIFTGATIWDYTTPNIVNSSPIVYGGNIIFGCNDNFVYCVDSISKDIRWKFKTNDRVMSSAAAYRNTVFIGGYDSYVYAINVLNGELKWKFKTGGLHKASLLNIEGDIYAASFDKHLYKLDTAGNLKWKFNVNGLIDASPILYDNNNNKTYYPSVTGMYQY